MYYKTLEKKKHFDSIYHINNQRPIYINQTIQIMKNIVSTTILKKKKEEEEDELNKIHFIL